MSDRLTVSETFRSLTTSAGVGGSDGRKLRDAIDVEDLDLEGGELTLDSCAGGRDVLEGSSGGLGRVEGGGELSNEGVGSESVEEVDVSGRARKDCSTRDQ